MTVDSGELFLAGGHAEQYRLDKFNASSGAFVSQFAQVPSLSYLHQGVAVGHSTGEPEVYVGGDLTGTKEGAVAVFDAAGSLQPPPLEGPKPPSEAFGCFECNGTGDVAVDSSPGLTWAAGDVYVADPEHAVVDVFKPKTGGGEEYITRLEGPEPGVPFSRPTGVAISAFNGDVLVVDDEDVVDIFKPAALHGQYEFVQQLTQTPNGSFGKIENLTVDGFDGDIYVVDATSNVVDQFNAAGNYLDRLTETSAGHPFRQVESVAVDPQAPDYVYVGDYNAEENKGFVDVFGPALVVPDVTVTEPVSNLTPTSATLHGTVNPVNAGEATCEFEYGTSTSYGKRAPCAARVLEGNEAVPVESKPESVTKLEPDTTYHYRLDATNVADGGTNTGQGPEGSEDLGEFTTLGPGIHEESVSNVAATSATLNATVNPHNAPTTYRFEYLTEAAYLENGGSFSGPQPAISVPRPDGVVGAGEGDVEVAQHVQGLDAGTVYHYRVVAVSEPKTGEFEEFDGPDQTFTTQTASAFALPDGRAWEMVSPPDKHGALIEAIKESGVIQASANGAAITYLADAPTETGPQGYLNRIQVLSTRSSGGWVARDIEIPFSSPTGLALTGAEYRAFSEDLSLGVLQPFGSFNPSLSSEASEQTAFLRTDYLGGDVNEPCIPTTMQCYRPLVTGAPGDANVPEGTAFGGETEGKCFSTACGPKVVGATPDESHVVLTSGAPLEPSTPVKEGLYEWSGGKIALVSVLPEHGGPVGEPGFEFEKYARHAISDDGSRVVWSASAKVAGESEASPHLYMRDTATGKTIQLDAVQGGEVGNEVNPVFQVASSDGSKVFFTDNQRLTSDSGAQNGFSRGDLYECEILEVGGVALQCRLSDLTPSSSGESAHVQGAVLGASEDGSSVYFVAQGVLTAIPNARGETAAAGQPNLYVRHGATTKLVAVLSGEDSPDWANGHPENLEDLTARVSPDGRWLAFMSQRSLTGYDTRDALSGKPDEEVYLYDASSGRVVCASCNPSGARPVGVENKNLGAAGNGVSLVGGNAIWPLTTWLAANIPGWTPYRNGRALYQSRYLSDNGRLFFNSNDALVPQDVNGTEDVYQYEPPSVGSCTTSAATFSERSGGCVALISSGTSPEESAFLDASATGGRDAEGHEGGGDVFFLTAAKLAPQDFDTALDVYDAHECTTAAPCFPVPAAQTLPCTAEASCRPAPSPQPEIFGPPPSATFSGAGNLAPLAPKPAVKPKSLTRAQKLSRALKVCKKKRQKKRAACEKQARRAYGAARKAKKSRKEGK